MTFHLRDNIVVMNQTASISKILPQEHILKFRGEKIKSNNRLHLSGFCKVGNKNL